MTTNVVDIPAIVRFPDYLSVKPRDLIRFNERYIKHIPFLMNFVRNNVGKDVKLFFTRLNPDGSLLENKAVKCFIESVEKNRFTTLSNESLFGNITYEQLIRTLVRTENFLGIIPLLEDFEPFNDNFSPILLTYLEFLKKVKRLMLSCVGLDNASTFMWRYNEPFHKGNFLTKGKVTKVNESNVEYDCVLIQTPDYKDIIPHPEVDRFIAPDRYLQGFETEFGILHKVNPWDWDIE
jgi:hypothetical protein